MCGTLHFYLILLCIKFSRYSVNSENIAYRDPSLNIPNIDKKIDDKGGCELGPILVPARAKLPDPTFTQQIPWTRVQRCDGYCRDTERYCQPSGVRNVTKYVELFKIESPTSAMKQLARVTVEEHTGCQCGCITREENCSDVQKFNNEKCLCECVGRYLMNRMMSCSQDDKRIWNKDVCYCQCKDIRQTCTTGSKFSHADCKCSAVYEH